MLSTLEPLQRQHGRAFQSLASDDDVVMMCGFPTPFPERGAAMWIERSIRRRAQDTEFSFAVMDSRRELTGVFALTSVSQATKSCHLTYWIGKPYWGLGLATSSAAQVVKFGVQTLGLNRITAQVFAHNYRSIDVLKRAGFSEYRRYCQQTTGSDKLVFCFQAAPFLDK